MNQKNLKQLNHLLFIFLIIILKILLKKYLNLKKVKKSVMLLKEVGGKEKILKKLHKSLII